MIAGIKAPDSTIARQAEQHARAYSNDVLFNHVMRCYYFGELFARQNNVKLDQELLFVSAVLHDLGFTEAGKGPHRFEVEGAHAARKFLLDQSVQEERAWQVWHNIALHVGDLNLFKDEPTRVMQQGILYDLTALPPELALDAMDVAEVIHYYPRLGFKQGFLEIFTRELDSKQPYPHRFHLCSCIEHHRSHALHIPKPEDFLGSAPFAD